ncbi:Transcriptional regulator, LysR family protein [Enhygromyxa salina]|uniref:Transcriptional regulator, LysR family protein n=1 Tax=Enhygromyxa salina TaxID=215803 RepID=A0A0C1ZSL2_9BACT|nr:LysR family transcriptional regulator [Enhygromyxa salina]KIG14053.1 Transcriptional regulator, LysR family protein [Enhygromyxa salina]
MDLEELRAFLAVVETGSFLGASTQLGVPRGTLRRRVDTLEARVGVALVERGARGVTLTPAGRILTERGRTLLAEGAALMAAARDIGRGSSEPLRIVLPPGLPPAALTMVLLLHESAAPELALELSVRANPHDLTLDDADFVVHFGAWREDPAWVSHELVSVPLVILASRGYLDRRSAPRTAAELAEHPLAAWTGPGVDGRSWPLRDGGHLDLRPRLVTNDAHHLRAQVIAHRWLALLPDADLDPFGLADDGLVRVLEADIGGEVSLCATVRRTLAERPGTAKLMHVLRGTVATTSPTSC